jgi:hypothetical protein
MSMTYDLISHLYMQREWSKETFGPYERSAGCIDHIRKELIEIEENPRDVEEWIDVVLLALDGAWRQGHQPEAICASLAKKLHQNMRREWPDWTESEEGKAIEHKRGTSA